MSDLPRLVRGDPETARTAIRRTAIKRGQHPVRDVVGDLVALYGVAYVLGEAVHVVAAKAETARLLGNGVQHARLGWVASDLQKTASVAKSFQV